MRGLGESKERMTGELAFVSTEVRWFFEGPLPPRVLAWFHTVEQKPQEQPSRVDYYLDLGAYDSLGIKLREGRIEIKQREILHGTIQLGAQSVGAMEQWRKWSWDLAYPVPGRAPGWNSSPAWIGVEKKRWLFLYQTGREGDIAPAPDGEGIEQGCQVELSRIQVQGQAGWSLSFEAFGGEAAGREALLLVAAQFLAGKPIDLPLSAANSYGYPKWLAGRRDGAPVSG
jgi:hypothetical protein